MLLLSRTAYAAPTALRPCTCSFSRSFSLSARPLAPPYLYTQLPTRAVLAVSGQDSQKFLQGLVSNDVRRLAQKGEEDDPDKQRVLYANILKADVRFNPALLAAVDLWLIFAPLAGPLHARSYALPSPNSLRRRFSRLPHRTRLVFHLRPANILQATQAAVKSEAWSGGGGRLGRRSSMEEPGGCC